MSNIFHPCLHCIFCCPAIIEYLAIHPISDILHQYQIWISNTSARVEYFAYLSMLNIMLHCQDGIFSYTVKVNYCAPLSRLFCALFSCWQKIMRKLFSLLLLCSHKRIYLFSSFCTKRRSLSQQVWQKKKYWNSIYFGQRIIKNTKKGWWHFLYCRAKAFITHIVSLPAFLVMFVVQCNFWDPFPNCGWLVCPLCSTCLFISFAGQEKGWKVLWVPTR